MKKIYFNLVALMVIFSSFSAQAQVNHLVISQVYGGGGNLGATYRNDFIELFNPTNATISVNGWSVQYASSGGTSWQVTALSGSIAPGHYYLIQEAAGTGGTINLPAPDATGSIAMSATAGKVALVNSATSLTVSCPSGVIDFVGFGGANCSETTPTPVLSNTTAAIRKNAGNTDTDNNLSDFTIGVPTPRNSGPSAPSASVSAGTNPAEPSTNGSFIVTLSSAAPAGGVTVTYSLNGTADQSDYSDPQNGSLTIPEGSTTGTINLTIKNDALADGGETILITLTGATGGFGLGNSAATLTIQDDDMMPANVVINQVYGGGGNSGATYKNDFIELYNNENVPVNLNGWSVQYAGATNSTWQVTALSGTIPAHGFYLVQEAQGNGGTTSLPSPDAVGTSLMSATSGKVILSNSTLALTGTNPTGSNVIDKVGYGGANGFETAPAPGTENATGVRRVTDGADQDNNATDFVVASPLPRNHTYTTAAPVVVFLNPPAGSTEVPYNIVPSLVFDKPVVKGNGVITVLENGVTILSIDVTSTGVVINDNNTVSINTSLAGGKTYALQIDAGAFKDVYGNSFPGINAAAWTFSTYNYAVPLTLPVSFDFQNCPGNGLLPGGFTQYSVTGASTWDCSTFGRDPNAPAGSNPFPNAVQMNGFAGGTNVPNTDWLISPAFDLTGTTYPLLSFWSRTAFNGQPLQLKVSTDYVSGDPRLATWTDVNGKFPALASNIWTESSGINLAAFKQPNVHFAFVYTSSDEEGARWTLDDIALINSSTPPPPSLTLGTPDVQFSYVAKGSSLDKTFSFTGNDLTDGVTLSADDNFLLSKDGVSFGSSVSYTLEEANNLPTTVHVRFAPSGNNQNFTGAVTVQTSGLTGEVHVTGTSIDPATTLEVVNWNMEWFGSTDPSLGPTNDDLQQQNAEKILKNIGADVFGLVEVVDEERLAAIVRNMPGYSYVICNYGSHVNPPEPNGSPLSAAQKEAFVYKTSLFSNVTTRPLINNQNTGSTSYNNWSSGRYPFLMTADVTLNCVTKRISFVLVHAKANTSPTATSYARRQAAAQELHDTLMAYFPSDNVIVLGDFNDDLDKSITAGFTTTSYSAFTNDQENFYSPTLALSLAGKKSTVSYNDVIDHVVLSNEMQPWYMPSSANILTDVASLVSNYGSTTTDHYPVFTRYQFPNTTAPVVTYCPVVPDLCSNSKGAYTIPAFTATDDCDTVQYSYAITGATERTGTGNDASGQFNVGTSTITWTATDNWNNTVTCQTTIVVNASPTVTIPDAYAFTRGAAANTVYIGYAPASVLTLAAQPEGGSGSNAYSWTAGAGLTIVAGTADQPSVKVYAHGTGGSSSTLTVTITDSKGCTATSTLTVYITDVRSGNKNDKVRLCHNAAEISVDGAAVQAHLDHGDALGSCSGAASFVIRKAVEANKAIAAEVTLIARPNPSASYFTIQLQGSQDAKNLRLKVTDILGRTVEQRNGLQANQSLQIGQDYRPGIYWVEILQGSEKHALRLVKLSR